MNSTVVSPQSTRDLLAAVAAAQGKPFRFGAGYTDLLLLLEAQSIDNLTIINLGGVRDARFTTIVREANGIRLGAMATAAMIAGDAMLARDVPVLVDAATQHASRQIREVATVGGNLCTASPAGDMACALVALGAECEIMAASGATRTVPVAEFFTGLRATALRADEVLYSIFIPVPSGASILSSRFIKVGARRSMECAVVSLACHIGVNAKGTIVSAGVAIGSAAPVTRFAAEAGAFLIGKSAGAISPAMADEFAARVVACASPISDIRGSAWYRTTVLRNIGRSVIEELIAETAAR